MAFFGIALSGTALVIGIRIIFFTGLTLIVIGAVMQKKDPRRKLAVVLKIIGYFIVIPLVLITLLLSIADKFL